MGNKDVFVTEEWGNKKLTYSKDNIDEAIGYKASMAIWGWLLLPVALLVVGGILWFVIKGLDSLLIGAGY